MQGTGIGGDFDRGNRVSMTEAHQFGDRGRKVQSSIS